MYEPEKTQGKNVSAVRNQDFVSFAAKCGRGVLFNDPRVPRQLLKLDDSIVNIGDAILNLLQQSSVLSNDELQEILKSGEVQKAGDIWERSVCKQFSYKTKRALYGEMLSCNIKELDGMLIISPTNHHKLGSWIGMKDVENVLISATSSSEEVGLALYEAFSRCKTEVG